MIWFINKIINMQSTRTRVSSLSSSRDTTSSARTLTSTSQTARNISRVSCESSTTPSRPCLTTRQKNKVIKREHDRKSSSLRRDEAKTQFLRVMYGGKPDTLCIETRDKQSFFIDWTPPDFLRLFHKEFQKNSTTLLSLDEFKTYMKDNRNPLGTGMSLLAQDIERQVISVAIQTFNQNEYTTGTIIHDGFLVESLDSDQCSVAKSCSCEAHERVRHQTREEVSKGLQRRVPLGHEATTMGRKKSKVRVTPTSPGTSWRSWRKKATLSPEVKVRCSGSTQTKRDLSYRPSSASCVHERLSPSTS